MRALFLTLAFTCLQASAQIILRIDPAAPVTVSPETLAKLTRHAATLNDHGKQVNYEGALLRDLLSQSGVDFGKHLNAKQLSSYVAVSGTDGYKVVYALAELDPTIADSNIIIADKRDGQALSATEGPLRLIAPHDGRPARSVRMLQEIDVVQLRQ